MSYKQTVVVIYSLNNKHFKGEIEIDYNSYDPRLSEFILKEAYSLNNEEDVLEELELNSERYDIILKYCVSQKLGVYVSECIEFKCRVNTIYFDIPYTSYNLAAQLDYLDNCLDNFNFESDSLYQKLKAKTVHQEVSMLRGFIEILPFIGRAVVNEITKRGNTRVSWTA